MSQEDKVLYGLLRLSLRHNSQVLEASTYFIGNIVDSRSRKNAVQCFRKIHNIYNKEYEDLISKLEEKDV